MLRTNLVFHLYCSECGNQLSMVADGETLVHSKPAIKQTDPEPASAACNQVRIHVERCRHCLANELGPARQLAAAVQSLLRCAEGMNNDER